MLIMPGLLALMPPTICCVRSQSVRDLVTEISGGATPHRCGVAQSSSSELATQAWPSQPHSRLMTPVRVGGRLASSGSPTLSRTPTPCTVHTSTDLGRTNGNAPIQLKSRTESPNFLSWKKNFGSWSSVAEKVGKFFFEDPNYQC